MAPAAKKPPSRSPAAPELRPRGRPKGDKPPRKTTTVRIEQDLLAWIQANLPRSISISAFINSALRDTIDQRSKGKKK